MMTKLEKYVEIAKERELTVVDLLGVMIVMAETYDKAISELMLKNKYLQSQIVELDRLRSLNQDQINEIDEHLGGILYE